MDYRVPIKDIKFVWNDVLDMDEHYKIFSHGQLAEPDLVEAIIQEAATFSEQELVPLNKIGDEQGCQFDNGFVTTPKGFKEAYQKYVDNGWHGLSGPEQFGGQDLPESLAFIVMEMLCSANHSWSMYPGLTGGAIKTILAHAPDNLKTRFLPNMVQGAWSGTMCLTEPHCGSDLGLLKTAAIPDPDSSEEGAYLITGSKIFISSGEHDLTDNIMHIVLARLPDAPVGIKGISLFAVPKVLVNEDSSLGERNTVSCGSIEHKMGIHGNATCVINFDAAKGYLISEPHKGMRSMFTFINESRLGVALQAQAHCEVSFQKALGYAKERIQMRAPKRHSPDKPADPIIAHPDVRRMLMTQKAFAEGGRVLNMYCAKHVDIVASSDFSDEERQRAQDILSILTPISKGFLSEVSMEATTYGIQVLGGHGFIQEWGLEQELRDTRITSLYEGTTGIQGLDLLGRKILKTRGKAIKPWMEDLEQFIADNKRNKYVKELKNHVKTWKSLTRSLGFSAMKNLDEVNGAAVEYLMFCGYVTLAFCWAKSAVTAEQALDNGTSEPEFYKAKLATCEFYFQRILPRVISLEASMKNGVSSLMALDEEHFIFI